MKTSSFSVNESLHSLQKVPVCTLECNIFCHLFHTCLLFDYFQILSVELSHSELVHFSKHKCSFFGGKCSIFVHVCELSHSVVSEFSHPNPKSRQSDSSTLWIVAHQAPLSRREHWNGLPCSSPGDLPNPRTEPASLVSPALAGGIFTTGTTWEVHLSRNS